MEKTIKELIDISEYAGNRVDYTQGGGGNTSVKIDNQRMIIKASGFKLKDINEIQGFVILNYSLIQEFIENVNDVNTSDLEVKNNLILKKAVISTNNDTVLRPSVEAGFHAILEKYVIHTHAVYANLLTCAEKGADIAKTIFNNSDFDYIMIPYVDPGVSLSVVINKEIKEYESKHDKKPEVIFLVNHGLIVTSNDINRVKYLHTKINEEIRLFFKLDKLKRDATIIKCGEMHYKSSTPFILKNLNIMAKSNKMISTYPLYPDQLVFLNNVLDLNPNKLVISSNKVEFMTDLKEAETMNEALFSFLFIVSVLIKNNLEITVMNDENIAFINGWEAERYRKKLAEKGIINEKN